MEESNDIEILEVVEGVYQEDIPEDIQSLEIPDVKNFEQEEQEKESENIEEEEEGGK